jgi:hypothetical protein
MIANSEVNKQGLHIRSTYAWLVDRLSMCSLYRGGWRVRFHASSGGLSLTKALSSDILMALWWRAKRRPRMSC